MGLVAVSAGTTAGGGAIDTLSAVGPSSGGIFIAFALIYLFAYLNLVEAAETERPTVRLQLIAAILPLSIAFAGLLLYSSLEYV